ncbi:MAG: GNAT family N-acetyltransferase [Anaerolineae bacterium]|nr:GNAT family N-acetyltransferase [Anaerolineae bacterium]
MQGEQNNPSLAGGPGPAGWAGIEIHPVTLDRWDDLVVLFSTSPVTGSCWCMSPRTRSKDFSRFGSESRRRNQESMHGLVTSGTVPGLLAYVDGRPAAWISIGPREEFARLQHSPALRPVDDLPVWSIVCFYTEPAYRGQGITSALIQAAVQHAAAQGAPAVEAYPIAAWGDSVGPGDAYTGTVNTFRRLGFEEVRVSSSRSRGQPRIIMRYDLAQG